jgi:hypothetical protein
MEAPATAREIYDYLKEHHTQDQIRTEIRWGINRLKLWLSGEITEMPPTVMDRLKRMYVDSKNTVDDPGLKFKLEYLFTLSSPADLGLVLNCSGKKLLDFVKFGIPLTKALRQHIETQYAMYEKAAPKPAPVKNYDDEDLSDLKAGTSRHGVNRSTSSFARSNNGWSGE